MRWRVSWRPSSLETRFSKTPPVATISYPQSPTAIDKVQRRKCPSSGVDSLLSWKVAFACFIFNVVTIGMFKTNSILFVEYLHVSGYTREIASWPFSIAGLSVIFVGPFVGVVSKYVSPRILCLGGAFVNFLGYFVSYFRTDIRFMIIFFGIVRGIGLAIVVSLIPVFINQYFQRHRASAQGLVGAGSPLGLMVCSFVIQFGLEKYALRGTMLLLAGVSLHAFAASLLLNTAPWLKRIQEPAGNDNPAFVEDPPPVLNGSVQMTVRPPSTNSSDVLEQPGTDNPNVVEDPPAVLNGSVQIIVRPPSTNSSAVPGTFVVEDPPLFLNRNVHPQSTKGSAVEQSKDIRQSSSPGSSNVLRDFLTVVTNCRFIMVALTFVTITNASLIFTIVIVDYAVDLQFTRDEGIYMLLAFSTGDILGKVGLGWVTDKKFLTIQSYFVLTVCLCGGMFIGLPYVPPVLYMYILGIGFIGILQGSALSLITLFFLEYLRKDQVPMAFSLYVSLAGLSSLSRPPLIGVFRDRLGSYDNLFRTAGGTLILAAAVWAIERIVTRMRRSKAT